MAMEGKHDNKEPIMLENCAIMKSRFFEGMKVVVNKSTRVSLSPQKFQTLKIQNTTHQTTTW